MKKNRIRFLSVFMSAALLLGSSAQCLAYAAQTECPAASQTVADEEPVLILSLKKDSPPITEILSDYPVESFRLISSINWISIYTVKFTDKNEKTVFNVIEDIKDNPYVDSASLDYSAVSDYSAPAQEDSPFIPGHVIVTMRPGATYPEKLLSGIDIASVRLLTPGSSLNIYLIVFTDKSTDVVYRAIEILKQNENVVTAEPDYYQYPAVEPEDPSYDSKIASLQAVPIDVNPSDNAQQRELYFAVKDVSNKLSGKLLTEESLNEIYPVYSTALKLYVERTATRVQIKNAASALRLAAEKAEFFTLEKQKLELTEGRTDVMRDFKELLEITYYNLTYDHSVENRVLEWTWYTCSRIAYTYQKALEVYLNPESSDEEIKNAYNELTDVYEPYSTPVIFVSNIEDSIFKPYDYITARADRYTKESLDNYLAAFEAASHTDYINSESSRRTMLPLNLAIEELTEKYDSETGDVDLDGDVTVKDATMIQRFLVNSTEPNEEQQINSDFNDDNDLSISDVTDLQKALANIL